MKQLLWGALVCFAGLHTTVAQIRWVKWMPGDSSQGLFIAADKSGHTYVAGKFYGTVTIDDHALTSRGDSDVFVVALNKHGNVEFTTSFGGPGADYPTAIAAKPNGDSFVAAHVEAGTELPDGTVSAASGACVIKFARAGNVRWARVLEDTNTTVASMRTEHSRIELWMCGYAHSATWTVGWDKSEVFTVGWDKKGIEKIRTVVEVPPLMSLVGDLGVGSFAPLITLDQKHNLLIAGAVTWSSISIGTNIFPGSSSWSYAPEVVAMHSLESDWLWAQPGFPIWPSYPRAVAIGLDGSVLTTGYTMLGYGGSKYRTLFVTRHSPEGELNDTHSRGEHRGAYDGFAVAGDRNGNIYAAGYGHEYYYDTNSRTAAFVLGPGFEYRVKSKSRYDQNYARGICVDDRNRVYVTGDFAGEADFGIEVLGAGTWGGRRAFVMRVR